MSIGRWLNTVKGERLFMLWQWPHRDSGWPPKIRVFFATFDFWVGGHWNKAIRTLYICPLPMLVIAVALRRRGGESSDG